MALGQNLFTFAIIADGHVNPQEDTSSSPWESNRLANGRNRFVVSELNRIAPAFVIHLGDMVHPVPNSPAYQTAINQFQSIFNQLKAPIHFVPGNHDVGDKPSSWVPAGPVNENYLTSYRRHFEKDYFSFDYENCNFVFVNCQLLGSDLPDEEDQFKWLNKNLQDHSGKRNFVFIHYPPFISDSAETEHYDNLKEPERSNFLKIIRSSNVEALFSGHVHNFFYNRFNNTDFYVLPSITFVRHDYSELSRISSQDEFGRDDKGKLGFFKVNVYERGHAVHFIRTWGRTLAVDEVDDDSERIDNFNSRETWWPGLGLDMRHPWAEVVELPYSGAVDEFVRKKVRNDYPFLALWEMGVRRMRIPWQDLADNRIRVRMKAMQELGYSFTLFMYDTPSRELYNIIRENCSLLEALEIIIPWREMSSNKNGLADLKAALNLPVYISKLRSSAESEKGSSKFQHFIKHGFISDEQNTIKAFLLKNDLREIADGFVFRVGRKDDLWDNIVEVRNFAKGINVSIQFQVMLANENPAVMEKNDLSNANRVAEALALSLALPDITIFLDTFIDMDRGYFPRNGLIDRRYNPRMPAHIYRNLNSIMGVYSDKLLLEGKYSNSDRTMCMITTKKFIWVLILAEKESLGEKIEMPMELISDEKHAELFDLVSGNRRLLEYNKQRRQIQFKDKSANPLTFNPPFLIRFDRH
jgi:hypothetical protein